MTAFDYDLFVIGAGSGGVRAARIAAKHGAKVAVAEEYRVGGTCVIRGCVPKKLLVYASKFAEAFEDAIGFGWTSQKVTFDWATLIENKDKEIDRLNKAYIRNLEGAGAELIMERAEIVDRNTVRLASGKKITAKYILIATGAAPSSRAICQAMNWRFPPTKPFTLKNCRAASALWAAAISRSSSPESSRVSALKPF
jgi:glutathione reductase (NADPH)